MKYNKLISVGGSGLVVFKDEFLIEIPDVPLVCVYGPNGSGKTSFIDVAPLSLWAATENRTADNKRSVIYDQFIETGYVESSWFNGEKTIRVRRLVNPKSRTMKRMIWIDTIQVEEADKETTFNQTILDFFGPNFTREIFLATAYTTQNPLGSILNTEVSERRKTTDQIFGLTEFQEPYQKVSDYTKATQDELNKVREVIKSVGDPKEIKAKRETAVTKLNTLNTEKADLTSKLVGLDVDKQQYIKNISDLEKSAPDTTQLIISKKEIVASIQALQLKKSTYEASISRLNLSASKEADLRKAEEMLLVREAELVKLKSVIVDQKQAVSDLEKGRSEKLALLQETKKGLTTSLKAEQTSLTEKRNALQLLKNKITESNSKKESRLKAAALLETVGCADDRFTEAANACNLLKDARLAKQDVSTLTEALTSLSLEVDAISIDNSEVDRLEKEILLNQKEIDLVNSDEAFRKSSAAVIETQTSITDVESRLAKIQSMLDRKFEIEAAVEEIPTIKATIADIDTQIQKANSDLALLEEQIKELESSVDIVESARKKLVSVTTEIESTQRLLDTCIHEIGAISSSLTNLEDIILKLADILKNEASLLELLTDLNDIKLAYSPQGARALIVEALSPQLTDTINTLLKKYYGDEFYVKFRTVKPLLNGKEEECYDVVVYDARGEVPPTIAANKCGGEKGILTEAVGLGVMVEAYRRSGLACKTLIRDEATSAMDADFAEKYMGMLMEARELTNVDTVLYITHNPILAMRADAYIVINKNPEPGQARIEVKKDLGIRE